MVADPLQHGIREDQVDGLRRCPMPDVAAGEVRRRQALAGGPQHVVEVSTPSPRARPPLGQELGGVAGAAAEVDDTLRRRFERHPREKVSRRPRPLVGEGEVERRVPVRHQFTGDPPSIGS